MEDLRPHESMQCENTAFFDTFIGHQLPTTKSTLRRKATFSLIDVYNYLQHAPIDLQKIIAQDDKFQYCIEKRKIGKQKIFFLLSFQLIPQT